MEPRHLLLMILDAFENKMQSKTRLHKIAYFTSIIVKEDFDFDAHYYGPYSQQIEDGLGELIGLGFLDVNILSYGTDYNIGFEKKRYDYQVTQSGKQISSHLKEKYKQQYGTITETVEKLKDKGYIELSIAAKAYFILNMENQPLTLEQIRSKAREFKWNIAGTEIELAVQILKELDLVTN